MRKLILAVLFSALYHMLPAQSVGIGTTTPHASAALDISSSNKGLIVPLMSQAQRLSINSPAEGLLLYDTTFQRFYQFQSGTWRYLINSDYWTTSTTRNFVYNLSDSIGIGTSVPLAKLDVRGTIRADNIAIASDITAGGNASGATIYSANTLTVGGAAIITGAVNSNGSLFINKANGTFQLKDAGTNKGYLQLSGNDLRFGTNSGNVNGKMIFRMNGDNVVQIDGKSNFSLLKGPFATLETGKFVMGDRLVRSYSLTPTDNCLPILYGRVFSDGFGAAIFPSTGSSERISTGVYEIDTDRSNLTANAVITVTATNGLPRICTARYIGGGKFRVEIFSLAGIHANNDFYFMINDVLN